VPVDVFQSSLQSHTATSRRTTRMCASMKRVYQGC